MIVKTVATFEELEQMRRGDVWDLRVEGKRFTIRRTWRGFYVLRWVKLNDVRSEISRYDARDADDCWNELIDLLGK